MRSSCCFHDALGCKFRFSVSTAERRRVFTVPSGSPVRSAISLCVSPSKYASSMAARCSFGRFSSAPFTRPSNCCLRHRAFEIQREDDGVFGELVAARGCGIVPPQPRDRAIARDHQQPAGQRAARSVELRRRAPELEEDILQDFLGCLRVAQNPNQDGREHRRRSGRRARRAPLRPAG